ncbi:MAG: trehalose-phosphatase, partial [Candidatus Aenigmatarchaeota archaeon]
MENLIEVWDEKKELFIPPLFLMTDYDGTLTPIVERPEDAIMSPDMRRKLERLTDMCPVAVVSGRELRDLVSRVNVDNVYYSGNHG